jgi:murein DD-endopeptidase MepM/ murein hydrolase activator NlpD
VRPPGQVQAKGATMKKTLIVAALCLLCWFQLDAETILVRLPASYAHNVSFADADALEESPDSVRIATEIQRRLALSIVCFPLSEIEVFTKVILPFGRLTPKPYLSHLDIDVHLGIDIDAPVGTPVCAAGNGTIVETAADDDFGNYVVIDHGSSIKTIYGHLGAFGGLHREDQVQAGQIIGYAGITGLVTDPCLHFAILYKGSYVNPQLAFPRNRWTRQ